MFEGIRAFINSASLNIELRLYPKMSWFYDPDFWTEQFRIVGWIIGPSRRIQPWKYSAIVTDLEGGIVVVYERLSQYSPRRQLSSLSQPISCDLWAPFILSSVTPCGGVVSGEGFPSLAHCLGRKYGVERGILWNSSLVPVAIFSSFSNQSFVLKI